MAVLEYISERDQRIKELEDHFKALNEITISFDKLKEMWYKSKRSRIMLNYGVRISEEIRKNIYQEQYGN